MRVRRIAGNSSLVATRRRRPRCISWPPKMLGDLLAWGAERVFGQRPGELLRRAAEDGGLTEPSEPGAPFPNRLGR